jgi:hypothetical protein
MTGESHQSGEPQVLFGLAEAALPEAVARSDRLFFHAALYSNFARDPAMAAALDTALSRPTFRGCDVVSLDTTVALPWRHEFYAVLRQTLFPGDLHQEFAVSDAFLADLAARHPGRVRRYATTCLPLAPIVLLDGTIYAGHYAHGPIPAPAGLWLALPAPVESLLRRAEADLPPGPGDRPGQAAYRFVHECVIARNTARPVA